MREFIKKIAARFIPAIVYAKIAAVIFWRRDRINIQQVFQGERVSFGSNNPNVFFYVIRRQPPGGGLMSNYLHVLGHIKIAVKRGMIPVVDMLNYETFYNEKTAVNGTLNPWEYYFFQPDQSYTLNEVYVSKNVVLSSFEFPHHEIGYSINECRNVSKIKSHNSYIKKYIKLNGATKSYIDDHLKKLNFNAGKILGVSVRGTDYLRLRPAGHPIQPSLSSVIESVSGLMQKWDFNGIYLCSEEDEVVDAFRQAFPGQVTSIDRMRVSAADKQQHTEYRPGEFVSEVRFKRDLDKYSTGLEYLAEMVLLTKCDFLLCAMTSGTAAAIFMNGGEYLGKEIFDLGVYPVPTS